MSITPHVCALILAGGQSSRMGGQDKAWLDLQGQPLIAHVLGRLALQHPPPARTLISANRHLDACRALGHAVVTDVSTQRHGPLAGIQAALRHCPEPMLLWVPCDAPFFPADLLTRLLVGKQTANAKAAVACTDGDNGGPSLEPCFALIDTDLAPSLDAALASGQHKLGAWLKAQTPALVHFCGAAARAAFANINTPHDLQKAGTP